MTFLTAMLTIVMNIWSFAAFACDGVMPEQAWGSDDWIAASHSKHDRAHLHLNRDAVRRGHCLTVDAEIAWSTHGLAADENGAPIPAAWLVERHSSAHAMFGLAQWVPGYGEAIHPVVPADACGPLTTKFPKGGVALVSRAGVDGRACSYYEKAKAAQEAGAEAVVIFDIPAALGHGEADCKSVLHYGGTGGNTSHAAWCYTAEGACVDGTASERFKAVEWSLAACSAPAGRCQCTKEKKEDFAEKYFRWSSYEYGYDDGYGYDDEGPNEFFMDDDGGYAGVDVMASANKEPSVVAMGCDPAVTSSSWWSSSHRDLGSAAAQTACASIKIPVLMLAHDPAKRLLSALKAAPHTTVDLMCAQVKHDFNGGGSGEASEALAEDTDAAQKSLNGSADVWTVRNRTYNAWGGLVQDDDAADDYYPSTYYDDDYYPSTHPAQVGNMVCNSLSFVCMVCVLIFLRPCQPFASASSLRTAILLSVLVNLLFLVEWILTLIDWDACYPNIGLYAVFAFWFVPWLIFGESRLLRAASARERVVAGNAGQEQGAWQMQATGAYGTEAAKENPIATSSTTVDETGYMDVGPAANDVNS